MSKEFSDVVHSVVDHGRSLKTEAPCDNVNVLRQPHGFEHLRSENSRVADFDPPLKGGVETEDFHGGLCVGVVGRFELDIFNTDLEEEGLDHTNQVCKPDVPVCNQAFNLMEHW